MHAKRCGLMKEQRNERRLHYCGTCKTLGSLYGQKTRALLNHDTVFLAEILIALSEKQNFGRALQSYNCLAKPKSPEEMPLALQIAATANVVLAEFKIGDRVEDSKNRAWQVVGKFFDKSFRKAEKQLKVWDFPLAELKGLPQLQSKREAEKFTEKGEAVLFYLAEPTAQATALFFGQGAKLIGREDLQSKMSALGAAFGEIVYLLDAFEDYKKDLRRGEFNAIRAAFDLTDAKLPREIRSEIENLLRRRESEIAEILHQLPLSARKAKLFALRLNENLSRSFSKSLPLAQKTYQTKRRKTVRERFADAIGRSRELSANSAWWQLPFAFAAVLVVAFLAPAQARETKNWRECYELGFNLMFLGAAFGAILALPKTIFLENPEELLTKEGRKKKARRAAANSNESGWCDGCGDCCGGGCCDGCCCACDGCDCCDCGGCCDCSCDS
ncbi:MAG TPA: DUF5685 family protein [Pyrinomonadaceae bacterium]|nr:DUF5685 family protein [Pyrinomonadaceae bacterium]